MISNELQPLSTREVLKCALQNEKIAFENYSAIGEIMLGSYNFAAARIFFEAADVEKGHFRRLQKALRQLYGIIVTDSTPLPFATECIPGSGDNACLLDIQTGMREEEAIRYMQEVERAAEKFYLEAADKTDRMDMKVLFRTLAKEEGRHMRLVPRIVRKALRRESGKAAEGLRPGTVH